MITGLHLTNEPKHLVERGFDGRADTLQAWAQGVYLTTDRESAALYDDGARTALVVQADIERPFALEIPERCSSIFEAVEQALKARFGREVAEELTPAKLRERRAGLAGELTRLLQEQGYDSLEIRMPWPVNREDIRSIHFGGNQLIVFDPANVKVIGFDAGVELPERTPPALAPLDTPPVQRTLVMLDDLGDPLSV